MFLNVVFTLVSFLIEFSMNSALTLVCLFIYISFVSLITCFSSIISWSVKLGQLTPPCLLYHAYSKISKILCYVTRSYSIYVPQRSIVVVFHSRGLHIHLEQIKTSTYNALMVYEVIHLIVS